MKGQSLPARVAFDARSTRTIDANGFMHVGPSNITKATVNPYYGREIPDCEEAGLDPDKIYHGLRDAAELEKSLPTWAGLPLLFDHIVDSAEKPQKAARVGAVGDAVEWAAPYLKAPLTIWDKSAQEAVNSGQMRELSCCYTYEPDFTSGVYDGQKYDFVMRNIKGNHVALVEEGRAGPDVFVADQNIFKKGKNMDLKEAIKTILAALGLGGGSEVTPPAGDNEADAENQLPVVSDEDVTELLPEMVALVEGIDDPEKALKMKAVLDRLTPGTADDENPDDDNTAADEGELDNKAPELLPGPNEQKTAQDRKMLKKGSPLRKPLALDANAIREQARTDTMRHFKELGVAATAMRPVLGVVDAYAYDSAADIYGAALKASGVDTSKYSRESWRGMAEMLTVGRPFAQDAAHTPSGEIHPSFCGLMAINPK